MSWRVKGWWSYCWVYTTQQHLEHLSVEHLSVEHLSVERLSVERLSVERLSVERLSVERLSVEHLSVEGNHSLVQYTVMSKHIQTGY